MEYKELITLYRNERGNSSVSIYAKASNPVNAPLHQGKILITSHLSSSCAGERCCNITDSPTILSLLAERLFQVQCHGKKWLKSNPVANEDQSWPPSWMPPEGKSGSRGIIGLFGGGGLDHRTEIFGIERNLASEEFWSYWMPWH